MQIKVCVAIVATALNAVAPAWWPSCAQEAAQVAASESDAHVDTQRVDKGKSLYIRYCSRCHGLNMITPGTVAFDLRQFPHEQKGRFVQSVTKGKNDPMPSWGDLLSRDDIDSLWAYVRTGG